MTYQSELGRHRRLLVCDMTCARCAGAVTKALKAVDAVRSTEVS